MLLLLMLSQCGFCVVVKNGAAVSTGTGDLVCFVSLEWPSVQAHASTAAMCWHTTEKRWHRFGCSANHGGGQIVALGNNTLLVFFHRLPPPSTVFHCLSPHCTRSFTVLSPSLSLPLNVILLP